MQPLQPMKTKQPRYYFIQSKKVKKHKVSFYDETGKRYAKFFDTKGEAVIYISELRSQLSLPAEMSFTIKERMTLSQIKFFCNEIGVTLESAFDFLRQNLKVKETVAIGFKEAFDKYVEFLHKKNARAETITGYIRQLTRFDKRESPDLSKYSTEDANNYLARIKSPTHAQRALRPFFKFCQENKWVNDNPFAEAIVKKVLKEKELPSVLSVANCKLIFKNCPQIWLPTLALMAFAGIRPQELLSNGSKTVLKVENIDFEHKKVVIPAPVAKTRRERHLNDLPANLWQWLTPLKTMPKGSNVAPASYDAYKGVKMRHIPIKLEKDVLRHSFGSYGYHYLGAEQTIEIMGHERSFSMLADHYKGLADKKRAIEYFSIVP